MKLDYKIEISEKKNTERILPPENGEELKNSLGSGKFDKAFLNFLKTRAEEFPTHIRMKFIEQSVKLAMRLTGYSLNKLDEKETSNEIVKNLLMAKGLTSDSLPDVLHASASPVTFLEFLTLSSARAGEGKGVNPIEKVILNQELDQEQAVDMIVVRESDILVVQVKSFSREQLMHILTRPGITKGQLSDQLVTDLDKIDENEILKFGTQRKVKAKSINKIKDLNDNWLRSLAGLDKNDPRILRKLAVLVPSDGYKDLLEDPNSDKRFGWLHQFTGAINSKASIQPLDLRIFNDLVSAYNIGFNRKFEDNQFRRRDE